VPNQGIALPIVSMILAIPLFAIAGEWAGVPGIALVCLSIVLINYFSRR
jgi:hypothetical protein